MEVLLILWGVFVVIVIPIMTFVANSNIKNLRQKIETLETKLKLLESNTTEPEQISQETSQTASSMPESAVIPDATPHPTNEKLIFASHAASVCEKPSTSPLTNTFTTPSLATSKISEIKPSTEDTVEHEETSFIQPAILSQEPSNISKPVIASTAQRESIAPNDASKPEVTSAIEQSFISQETKTKAELTAEIKAESEIAAAQSAVPKPPQPVQPAQPPQSSQPKATSPNQPTNRVASAIPGLFASLSKHVKNWFTTGNVPVKIGVLVLFAGVAALLRYVTQQGWVVLPMQARLALVAALSFGALLFAWRKRESHRVFSLSVQGGALGILMLVIFAAFKLKFIGSITAFVATVLVVMCTGVLAITQNALTLAIFSILAGFLAPIWLSSGSNNYVALFSYYTILNAGIFIMSWWRSWRMLNALGFGFTFGIASLWGAWNYDAKMFATTEFFLILFFAFYLFLPLLYARVQSAALGVGRLSLSDLKKNHAQLVDALLVFGTPLVAFSLQAALLQHHRGILGLCAFAIAVIYTGLSHICKQKQKYQAFVLAYQGLALVFATLAIPLSFSALPTGCIYVLEGALLLWWGTRFALKKIQLVSWGIQALAILAYTTLWSQGLGQHTLAINTFIFAVMYAIPAWYFFTQEKHKPFSFIYQGAALAFTTLAIPIEFSFLVTSGMYAVMGAIVLWWAVKHALKNTQIVSWGLHALAALVFFSTFNDTRIGSGSTLALNAFMLCAIYTGFALFFYCQKTLKPFFPNYLGLTLVYLTIAIPLQFSTQTTCFIYALGSVPILWVGLKQAHIKIQWIALGWQAFAVIAFIRTLGLKPFAYTDAWPVLNIQSMNILILSMVFLFSAYLYNHWRLNQTEPKGRMLEFAKAAAIALYCLGLFWWGLLGFKEIYLSVYVTHNIQLTATIVFIAATMGLLSFAYRKLQQSILSLTICSGFFIIAFLCGIQIAKNTMPLLHYGWLAWLSYLALGAYSLHSLRNIRTATFAVGRTSQLIWLFTWNAIATSSLFWCASQLQLNSSWHWAALIVPTVLIVTLSLWKWSVLSWPQGLSMNTLQLPMQYVLFFIISVWWIISLFFSGAASPLPWIALLNPIELIELATLFMLWNWYKGKSTLPNPLSMKHKQQLIAVMAFVLSMVIILRAVHHWGGIPWDIQIFMARLTQTSLSVVWSLMGVYAWVRGSRRMQRSLWIFGAVLMSVVLLKLLLVDRQNLGNVLGITSFIAYGLLCILIGYLAPAPPKTMLEMKEGAKQQEE